MTGMTEHPTPAQVAVWALAALAGVWGLVRYVRINLILAIGTLRGEAPPDHDGRLLRAAAISVLVMCLAVYAALLACAWRLFLALIWVFLVTTGLAVMIGVGVVRARIKAARKLHSLRASQQRPRPACDPDMIVEPTRERPYGRS